MLQYYHFIDDTLSVIWLCSIIRHQSLVSDVGINHMITYNLYCVINIC